MLFKSSSYEIVNEIGAYGTVYKARDKHNPSLVVALKKVRVTLTEDGVPNSAMREIALLKQLEQFSHPNIVKLIDVCHGTKSERELTLYLVFEHLEMDLAGYIQRLPIGGLKPKTIQRLSMELLTGVDFLHSHRIIHRDLKPQNLLVSSLTNPSLKLADFGLAKTYDYEMRLTSVVVTLWYRAPEVLLNQPYTSALDIWSSACIIAELFQRHALFPGTSERNQLERIFDMTGTPSANNWPDNVSIARESFAYKSSKQPRELCDNLCEYSNDLLAQMLAFEPKIRPSAAECLQHFFFQQEPI